DARTQRDLVEEWLRDDHPAHGRPPGEDLVAEIAAVNEAGPEPVSGKPAATFVDPVVPMAHATRAYGYIVYTRGVSMLLEGRQRVMACEAGDMAARLRAELPGALRGGQVTGYFQPQVELPTGRLVAAELLARWEHPELGVLQPAVFLPLMEELGLTGELC